MKIRATVTDGKMEMVEEFEDGDITDPKEYMEQMLSRFNSSLRPGESARSLVSVEKISDEGLGKHDWEKTNLVTIKGRGCTYDTARCRRCGVTGRRYGLGNAPTRDRRYAAKKYEDCNWMSRSGKKEG